MRKHQSEALNLEMFGGAPGPRGCDAPGCRQDGVHRAPKARNRLDEYYWFCLDHVRDYNRAWNYLDGLNDDDLEREIRRSTTWERPSWPFGLRRDGARIYTASGFKDPFEVFEGDGVDGDAGASTSGPGAGHGAGKGSWGERSGSRRRAAPPGQTAEQRAFALMGLDPPVTLAELKTCYKELVKRHHPDANGGDKAAEERLKLINDAYTTLKRFLS
jgi:hypothetical protein